MYRQAFKRTLPVLTTGRSGWKQTLHGITDKNMSETDSMFCAIAHSGKNNDSMNIDFVVLYISVLPITT